MIWWKKKLSHMKKSECKTVLDGRVNNKGKSSIEFYKFGRPQRYCMGLIDLMYNELLQECKDCQMNVYKVDDDKWKKEGKHGK